MTIRVLIADDQALVRGGFRVMIGAAEGLDLVGEAVDGAHAVELATRLRPDVTLMDIRMPRMDGLEATRRLVADATEPVTRVIVVTTFDDDEYLFDAIHAGASGFLLKDVSPDGLVDAIYTVHAGNALLAPTATRRLISEFTRSAPRRRPPERLAALTNREQEVLQLVARGRSNGEIAREMHVGEATVKTHVGNILLKLGLRNRVQAVVLAHEAGLVEPRDM